MDIDLARTFLAVIETGSFQGAARKVHAAQSTVSARIQTLEDQLGREVFVRGRAGAALTPAGRRFQRHAEAMTRAWAHAKLDVGVPDVFETSLHVAAHEGLWDRFLTGALPALRAALPNVAFKASRGQTAALTRDVVDGQADLAVVYQPTVAPSLTSRRLFDEAFVLVDSGPDDAGLAERYVFIDWGAEFRSEHLRHVPELSSPGLQLTLGPAGLQFLLTTPAAGYFPRRLVQEDVDAGGLRVVEAAPVLRLGVFALHESGDAGAIPRTAANVLADFCAAAFNAGGPAPAGATTGY